MKPSHIFSIFTFVFIFAAIPLGVYLANRPLESTQTKASLSYVVAYFDRTNIEVKSRQTFTLSLKVDTGQSAVGGMFGAVEFDPTMLQLVNANPDLFFSDLKVVTTPNRLNLSATEKVAGNSTVVTLTFLPLRSGTTEINLSDNFEVQTAKGDQNALTQTTPSVKVSIK
jgi:hypothetical protein